MRGMLIGVAAERNRAARRNVYVIIRERKYALKGTDSDLPSLIGSMKSPSLAQYFHPSTPTLHELAEPHVRASQ